MSSWVYFIQAEDGGPIKVGFTSGHPEVGLGVFQAGCPVQLRIIEQVPGDFQMEQRIHRALDAHRLHGEWFADVEAVREVIANPHSFGDAEEPETLGGRIRACRMRLGMDQTTFGWRVGVSQTQIARWESDRHEPRVSSIAAIARLAGVALSWLAYGEASEELAA